jgi:hypothetical protein
MTKAIKTRDPRLDFFRGLGMFIILIAHIPGNPWAFWIPARFGFSDATEMFVFCSGMASALAFGSVYARAGWLMGTMQITYRVWQVYWVHLSVFFVSLTLLVAINSSGVFPRDEVAEYNLQAFLENTGPNLIGLLTLTYVPNFFDILPMYLVILALLPVIMALARFDVRLAMVFSIALWGIAGTGVNLPAELWFSVPSDRPWFFNPFAWQFLFFSGFAFMAGWLPAPPVRRGLIWLAVAIIVISVPLTWYEVTTRAPAILAWREEWAFLLDKTQFGALRYVHFLALAYLAWAAAGPAGQRLKRPGLAGRVVGVVSRVGQQSLAAFAASMVLAFGLGAVLNLMGGGAVAALLINLAGILALIAVARLVHLFKSKPWARQPTQPLAEPTGSGMTFEAPPRVMNSGIKIKSVVQTG